MLCANCNFCTIHHCSHLQFHCVCVPTSEKISFGFRSRAGPVDLEAWTLSLRFQKRFLEQLCWTMFMRTCDRSELFALQHDSKSVWRQKLCRQRLRVSNVLDLIRVEFIINFIITGSSNIFFTSHIQTIVATLSVEKQKLLWASKFSLSLNYCFVSCVVIAKDGSEIAVRCCHLAVNLFII